MQVLRLPFVVTQKGFSRAAQFLTLASLGAVTPSGCHNFKRVLAVSRPGQGVCGRPEPQTTKTNRAKSHGPTGYFSSCGLRVLATFPLWVMFLLCFSLAIRIRCLATMARALGNVLDSH